MLCLFFRYRFMERPWPALLVFVALVILSSCRKENHEFPILCVEVNDLNILLGDSVQIINCHDSMTLVNIIDSGTPYVYVSPRDTGYMHFSQVGQYTFSASFAEWLTVGGAHELFIVTVQ